MTRTQIGDLFGDDATYRYHPYDPDDDVVRGREAIVGGWIAPEGDASSRDAPDSLRRQVRAVRRRRRPGRRVGWSRYWTDGTPSDAPRATYDNVFLCGSTTTAAASSSSSTS